MRPTDLVRPLSQPCNKHLAKSRKGTSSSSLLGFFISNLCPSLYLLKLLPCFTYPDRFWLLHSPSSESEPDIHTAIDMATRGWLIGATPESIYSHIGKILFVEKIIDAKKG